MSFAEDSDSRLPLDVNHASAIITRFEEPSRIGEAFVMSNLGQTPSVDSLNMPDGRQSPAGSRKIKDFANQISNLKKENFSLKLRIFYMEEQMQEQFNNDYEHVYKANIELKVKCDGLRKELRDKHDLLVRASNAVACMEAGPEEIRKAQELARKELQQVKDAMNERVQEANKELCSVRAEADGLVADLRRSQDFVHILERDNETLKADLKKSNGEILRIQELLQSNKEERPSENDILTPSRNLELLNKDLQKKERLIEQLKETLEVKQTLVEALTDEKKFEEGNAEKNEGIIRTLEGINKELESDLAKRKQQEERLRSEYTQHIAEQQQRLDEYELAARQMSEELERREEEVKDLSEALKHAEDTGRELAENYDRQQKEKKTGTKELLMRDKAITGLTEVVQKKDKEIERLKENATRREAHLEELTNIISSLTSKEEALGVKVERLTIVEKEVMQLKALNHNLNLQNQKLTSQLTDANGHVRSMEEILAEKDRDLKDLHAEYNLLLERSQEDEIAKIEASKEREDMAQRFEREKREFSEVVRSMRRQFDESPKDNSEKGMSQEILQLQQQLQADEKLLSSKQSQLEEVTRLFKKAEDERKTALEELEDAMRRRTEEQLREAESRSRVNVAKTADIQRLREEIRAKDDRIENLEDDVLQLEQAVYQAGDKAAISGKEAVRWKEHCARKNASVNELSREMEAFRSNALAENNQMAKLARENVELQQQVKVCEAKLSQNDRATGDPHVESLRQAAAGKDRIVTDDRSKLGEDTSTVNVALDALRSEVENHKIELEDAKNLVRTLTSELENCRQRMLALHQACNAKDKVIEGLKTFQRQPAAASESGSSTPAGNATRFQHGASRQHRFTKRKQKSYQHESDSSVSADSVNQPGIKRSLDHDGCLLPSMMKNELRKEIRELHKEIEDIKGVQRNETNLQGLIQKLEQQSEHLRRLTRILTVEQRVYREQLNLPEETLCTTELASDDGGETTKLQRAKLDWIFRQVKDVRSELCALLLDVSGKQDVSTQVSMRDVSKGGGNENAELKEELKNTRAELKDVVRSFADLQGKATSDIELLKQGLDKKRREVTDLTIQLNRARSERTSMNDSDGTCFLSRRELRQMVANLKNKLENAEKMNERLGDQPEITAVGSNSAQRLTEEVKRLEEEVQRAHRHLGNGRHRRQRSQEASPRHSNRKSPRSVSAGGKLPACAEKIRPINGEKHLLEEKEQQGVKARFEPPQNKMAAAEDPIQWRAEKLKSSKVVMDKPHRARNASNHMAMDARMPISADDTGYASVSPKIEQKYTSLIQAQAKELSALHQQLKRASDTCKDLGMEYDIVLRYVTTLLGVTQCRADTMLATGVTNKLDRCRQLTAMLKQQLSECTKDGSVASDSDDSVSSLSTPIRQRSSSFLGQQQDIEEKTEKIRELEERLAGMASRGPGSQSCFEKQNFGFLTPASSHTSMYSYADEKLAAVDTIKGQEHASFPDRRSPISLGETPKCSPRLSKNLPLYQRTIAITEYLPSAHAGVDAGDPSGRCKLSATDDARICVTSFSGSWSAAQSPRKEHEGMPRPIAHSSPVARKLLGEANISRRASLDSLEFNDPRKEKIDLATEMLGQAKHASGGTHLDGNTTDMLDEIRALRQQLEESIETNRRLGEELERRLKQADAESESVSADSHDECAHMDDIENLTQELVLANEEVARLQSQLDDGIRIKTNFAAASQELDHLRMRLTESSRQTEILGKFIDDQKETIERKESEAKALHERLEKAEGDLKEAKDENATNKLEMETLKTKSDAMTESAERMREDLKRATDELEQSHHIVNSLKSELALHEKIRKSKDFSDEKRTPSWSFDVGQFLAEMKSLRLQLEKSIEANSALRKHLEQRLASGGELGAILNPGRTTTINIHHAPQPKSTSRDRGGAGELQAVSRAKRKMKRTNGQDPSSFLMTPPPSSESSCGEDRSPTGFQCAPHSTHRSLTPEHSSEKIQQWPQYDLSGPYVIGKLTDFNELKQVFAGGKLLIRRVERLKLAKNAAQTLPSESRSQRSSPRATKDVESNLRSLHKMLEDCGRILKLFWPASVPLSPIQLAPPQQRDRAHQKCSSRLSDVSSDASKCTKDAGFASDSSINSEAIGLHREVGKLHRKLSVQDKLLKTTVDRLQNANRLKEGIEHAILKQLSVTHDVLKKARGNLEVKASEAQPSDCRASST